MATSPKTSPTKQPRKSSALDLRIPENRLVVEIQNRRAKGLAKYGVGMERTDLKHRQWLQHAKEEALDLAVYLEKCIEQEDAKSGVFLGEAIKPETPKKPARRARIL